MLPTSIRVALVAEAADGARTTVRTTRARPCRRWRLVAPLVAALLAVTACGGGLAALSDPDIERPAPDSPDAPALATGINTVGYDLFRSEAADSTQDVVLSPLSIGLAFGMLDAGATGETADALDGLFDYPVEGEARWSAFNTLDQRIVDTRTIDDGAEIIVRLANRQFPDEAFEPVEGYDETIAEWFGAGIEPLPIRNDPDASRERINGWVSERTSGLIPDLLPDGFLKPLTKLVLVNALYFEATWATPFLEDRTEDADFTRLDGSTVTVPTMMGGGLPGPVLVTDDYEAIALAYADRDYEMLLVVPTAGRYAEVEAAFDGDLVAMIDRGMGRVPASDDPAAANERDQRDEGRELATDEVSVMLYLPRFESEMSLPLREPLEQDLGVTGLFDVMGGLAGIHSELLLGDAIHAADIAVDEQGTIAAAATALAVDAGGEPAPPTIVRVDRPFLYLIRHQPTGANLFVGRVLDPSA
jgi:serpin B